MATMYLRSLAAVLLVSSVASELREDAMNRPKAIIHKGSKAEKGEVDRFVIMPESCTDEDLNSFATRLVGDVVVEYQGHPSQGGLCVMVVRGMLADVEAALKQEEGALNTKRTILETDARQHVIPEIDEEDEDEESGGRSLRGLQDGSVPWNLDRLDDREGLDQEYSPGQTGYGVHIYVFDTGIRTTHEDFGGRAIPTIEVLGNGVVECSSDDTTCADDKDGHGTHCAGTVGGTTYGVAKQATLHAVKVLDDDGFGEFSWDIEAIDWIMQHGIAPKVISASLGGAGWSPSVAHAYTEATKQGITVVVAAGNENDDACNYFPAMVPSVITVAAVTRKDKRPKYSNYGSCVDIFAPGSGIVSAHIKSDSAMKKLSGTSMACPHVAGAAALLLETNSTLAPAHVAHILAEVATPDAVRGPKGSPNKLLYWHSNVSSAPLAPAPTVPSTWFVASGPCKQEGDCIMSPRFPRKYKKKQSCHISVPPGLGPISVEEFVTEKRHDTLWVNGVEYSGKMSPVGVTPTSDIWWVSDDTKQKKGWKICAAPAEL